MSSSPLVVGGDAASKLTRQQSLRWLPLRADSLLRISILHEQTGVPLFDQIWRWRGHEESSTYSDLVQSALKVGQSMRDSGGIRYVLFEPLDSEGPERPGELQPSKSQPAALRPPRRKHKPPPLKISPHLMRLVLIVEEGFVITIFHGAAASWDAVDLLGQRLVKQFSGMYGKQVADAVPSLRLFEKAKSKGQHVDLAPIQAQFAAFIAHVQQACLPFVDMPSSSSR